MDEEAIISSKLTVTNIKEMFDLPKLSDLKILL